MRKLLTSNLKASGYAARSAADGAEAPKLIEEHRFDLLLLDINMPGPNGLQVLETVRRDADIPILMLSARSRERDLRRVTPGQRGPLPAYRFQGLELDFAARRARVGGVDAPLTRCEFEVLA